MLQLRHGRTLEVGQDAADELVEIRNGAGAVELRVRLTEHGVILRLEGARISLKATESVDVECRTFNVSANQVASPAAEGEVRVQGALIRLN